MQLKVIPKIFEVYPEAEKLVDEFASKNLETLSSESMALHIKTVILPRLHNKHMEEQLQNNMLQLSMEDFCAALNVSTILLSTTLCWLSCSSRFVGFMNSMYATILISVCHGCGIDDH